MTQPISELDLGFALDVAEGTARAAGALIRQAFKKPRNAQDKGTNDLVTDTDRASEALCARLLQAAMPMCSIAGEEGVRSVGNTGNGEHAPLTWWIDPLDGTYNFVHGVPRFTVSIGGVDPQGQVIVGVVYDPNFDECYKAIRGQGATCNGEPIHVSPTAELRRALAASGFPGDLRTSRNNTAEWSAMVPRC